MSYMVSSQNMDSITLNETDTVKSVLQNVAIILKTRQQSVPLCRDFGLPMQFIDKPIPVARAMLVAEIHEAIAKYEPRATVLNVTFEVDYNVPGTLIPTVEVEVTDG